jgi:hypothetical protein
VSFTETDTTNPSAGVEDVEYDSITDEGFESGQAEGEIFTEDTQTEEVESVPTYLDPETYGSHLVKVKVNGEEVELPFSEALNGVMMQQSYTRKTQELAQMRQELSQAERIVQALQADPAGTIRLLANSYGVGFESEVDEYGDPVQSTPNHQPELVARLDRIEQMQRQVALDREVTALEGKYGAFDVDEVMRHALEIGTANLEVAYRDLHFESLRSRASQQEALKLREQDEQKRLAAKRSAQVVPKGARAPSTSAPPQRKFSSIRESFLAAKEQHGLT